MLMCRHGENIYKRKDGRYEGRYVVGKNPDGTTKFGYLYGTNFYDLRARLIAKKHEREITSKSAASRCTFSVYANSWLSGTVLYKVKPSTYSSYCHLFRTHIYPELGQYYLSEITPEHIMKLIAALQKKGLSDGTIKLILCKLNAVLTQAVGGGKIDTNPCDKVHYQEREYKRHNVLTSDERKALIAALTDEDLPILFAMLTGARLGEICALKWIDIDWTDRVVYINRSVARLPDAGDGSHTALHVGSTKSRQSHRRIPLCDHLLDKLRVRSERPHGEYVFGRGDRPMEPRTLQRHLKSAARRAGIADIHFHMLRHDFITQLVANGVDMTTVRDIAGHKSASTTMDFYVHTSFDNIRDSITKSMIASLNPS